VLELKQFPEGILLTQILIMIEKITDDTLHLSQFPGRGAGSSTFLKVIHLLQKYSGLELVYSFKKLLINLSVSLTVFNLNQDPDQSFIDFPFTPIKTNFIKIKIDVVSDFFKSSQGLLIIFKGLRKVTQLFITVSQTGIILPDLFPVVYFPGCLQGLLIQSDRLQHFFPLQIDGSQVI